MCGIVGVISSDLMAEDVKYFTGGLLADTIRGAHSTGIAYVGGEVNHVHKSACNGATFIETKAFKTIMDAAEAEAKKANNPAVALMGHNRYATMGAVNKRGAHPFTHGKITGMHNGTLYYHENLEDKDNKFEIDSEAIMFALSKCVTKADTINVLEKLNGAFALTWYNSEDNTVNIARNDERPLTIAYSEDGGTVIWASEQGMLSWICNRSYKNKKFTYKSLTIGELFTFNLYATDLEETVENTTFVPAWDNYNWSYGNGWYDVSSGSQGVGGSKDVGKYTTSMTTEKRPINIQTLPYAMRSHTISEERVVSWGLDSDTEYVMIPEDFAYTTDNDYLTLGRCFGHLEDHPHISVELTMQMDEYEAGGKYMVRAPFAMSTGTGRADNKFLYCTSWRLLRQESSDEKTEDKVEEDLWRVASNGCGLCHGSIYRWEMDEVMVIDCPTEGTVVVCPYCVDDEYVRVRDERS